MPGQAPPDIFLCFYDESEKPYKTLVGESVDEQCPGGLFDPVPPSDAEPAFGKGWFVVTSFHFAVNDSGSDSGGGGAGAGGAPKGKAGSANSGGGGTASAKASEKGPFKGVSVTMPMQYGCIYLMHQCVKWAQKHQKEQKFKKIHKAWFLVRGAGLTRSAPDGNKSGQDYFMDVTLHDVTVEDYTTSSACDAETFTLNYESLQINYWPADPSTGQLDLSRIAKAQWSNSAGGDDSDNSDE